MTSTEIALPANLVDVRSGELLPATPENAVEVIRIARDMRRQILDVVRDAEAVLLERSRLEGTKTLHLPGGTATITGGSEIAWDLDVLAELQELGLPEDRYGELVVQTVSYKVDARVAKQLEAANPAYAEVIGRARSTVEKPWRVSVK